VSTRESTRRRLAAWFDKHYVLVGQLFVFAMVAICPNVAHAYMGQEFLNNVASYVIAPIALFMIVITLGAAMVKPDIAKSTGYVAVVAVALFGIIKLGGNIVTWLQGTTANN
jgi:hypothetical protein